MDDTRAADSATVAALRRGDGAAFALLLDSAKAAFTHGLQVTLTICAIVSLALSILAAIALRRSPSLQEGLPQHDRIADRQRPGLQDVAIQCE